MCGPKAQPITQPTATPWDTANNPIICPAQRANRSTAMRLGILADTHDELARTQLAVRLLREAGAEALVHCGDLAGPPIVEALAVLPCWFVFGNHDADNVPALRRAAAEFGPVCLG